MLQRRAFTNVAALGGIIIPPTTLNPSDKAAAGTLSGGNLTATFAGTSAAAVRSTTSKSTGKWHFEATFNAVASASNLSVGVVPSTYSLTSVTEFASPGGVVTSGGYVNENGGGGFNADSWSVAGNTIAFEFDADTNQFWVEKVGGTGRKGPFTMGTIGDTFAVAGSRNLDGNQVTLNFGASAFAITPTSGFLAWNS